MAIERRTAFFCVIRDAFLVLMVIRSVAFISWLLNQKVNNASVQLEPQYDWSLLLTALGWIILFFWFTRTQKKELAEKGDYSNILYRLPIVWLFYTRNRDKEKGSNDNN